MKKNIIILAATGLLALMTGCGTMDDSASDSISLPKSTAVSSAVTTVTELNTKPETTTTTNTTEASQAATNNANDIDITPLVGEWIYQKIDEQNYSSFISEGIVTVEPDLIYTYQPNDVSIAKTGTISISYDEYSTGDKVPFFSFYQNGVDFWIGAYCNQESSDIYYIGNGGMERLVRSNSSEYAFDEYFGQWQGDTQWNGCNLYIQINKDGDSMIAEVSAHSAVADYLWSYTCKGSDDNTYIECQSGGKLNRTDYAPNGDIKETVEVYNDGTAKFSIKGGTLFWQDGKEDVAHQIGFSKT